jgi:hypothetical protein
MFPQMEITTRVGTVNTKYPFVNIPEIKKLMPYKMAKIIKGTRTPSRIPTHMESFLNILPFI